MVYIADHRCVELFSSRLEKKFFMFLPDKYHIYNLLKEEWQAMHNLAENQSIIINPADKVSCLLIWD